MELSSTDFVSKQSVGFWGLSLRDKGTCNLGQPTTPRRWSFHQPFGQRAPTKSACKPYVQMYVLVIEKQMNTLKVTTVGHSLAVTIPKELVNRFHLQKGDEVFIRETPEGFEVSPFDPDFNEAMEAAAVVAKQYKNALRALAQK